MIQLVWIVDLYSDRFIGCTKDDVTFSSMKEGCHVDFDTAYSTRQVFLENFVGQLAVIPGTLLTALLLDKVGRVWLMGKYSVVSKHFDINYSTRFLKVRLPPGSLN